jgi:hypothetical protein
LKLRENFGDVIMKPNINFKKLAWISLGVLLFAIINGYLLFPSILKFILKRVIHKKTDNHSLFVIESTFA